MKPFRHIAWALLAGLCASLPAFAQGDYPNRKISIIVPYAAGGGADQVARLVARRLSERIKQSVIVENRGGASNVIGMTAVARSPADGYTIGLVTPTFLMTPSLIKDHPYDPVKDFAAIATLGDAPLFLAVNPGLPARNVKEFLQYAKTHPGQLNWASGGTASTQGLAGVMFSAMAGIQAVQIPYKGSAEGMTDLLAGNVQYMFNPMPSIIQHVRSGKLRILGVANAERSALHPEMPAIAETVPGFQAAGWFGLVVPAGTPKPVIERLNREISDIVSSSPTREVMLESGLEPRVMTADAFGRMLKADFTRYAKIFSDNNIKPE